MKISIQLTTIIWLTLLIENVVSTWRLINQEFVGSTWSDSVKNWKIVGVSTSPTSICTLQAAPQQKIYGGNDKFGTGVILIKSYKNLPPHKQLRIKFTAYFLSTNGVASPNFAVTVCGNYNASGFVCIDSSKIVQYNSAGITSFPCQNGANDLKVAFDYSYAHSAQDVDIAFENNFILSSSEINFAISDFSLEVDACHSSCLTCNGDMFDNCLTCVANTKPVTGNTCLCSDTYYPEYKQAPCLIFPCIICQKCEATCGNCYGPTSKQCLTCNPAANPKRYLQNFQCVLEAECKDGTYASLDTFKCEPCHLTCATCNGKLDSQCLSCPNLRYLNPIASTNGKCVSTCPIAKVLIGKKCLVCQDSDCIECENDLPNTCKTCTTDSSKKFLLFNKLCYATRINDQQYEDHQKGQIFSCVSPCLTCGQYSGTTCTSCVVGYSLYLAACQVKCPAGMYSLAQVCQPCNINCKTCETTDTNCLTCDTNMFVDPGDKKCKVCPPGTYGDLVSGTCKPCHGDCDTCDGGDDKSCLTCKTAGIKVYYIQSTKQCVDVCPAIPNDLYGDDVSVPKKCVQGQDCANQYYPDVASRLCKPCNPLCSKCFGPSNLECSECSGIKFLEGTECVDNCKPNKYPDAQRKCQFCDKSCKECTGGGPNNCVNCNTPLFLMVSGADKFCKVKCETPTFGNEATLNCVTVCDPDFYPNETSRLCTHCHVACNQCTGGQKKDCVNCASPYFKFGNVCDYCPDSYFGNIGTKVCDKCPAECAICTGLSTCQKCNPPYFLEGATCSLACPAPKWGSFITNACESKCPIGTYGIVVNSNQRICQSCTSNCANCQNQTACIDCFYPYFLNDSSQCIQDCPDNQFANRQLRTCQDCDNSCKTCIGPLPSNCKSCKAGLLYEDTCYSECPDGTFANGDFCSAKCEKTYYPDVGTKKCEKCNTNCQECYGKLFNNCITCPSGKILIDKYCVDKCQDGYYEKLINISELDPTRKDDDISLKICVKCSSECQLCSNTLSQTLDGVSITCSQCSAEYFLNEGKCIKECPSTKIINIPNRTCDVCPLGFFKYDIRTCKECHYSCKKCSGSNYNQCTECWDSRGRESKVTTVTQHLPYKNVCECIDGYHDIMESECTSQIGNEVRTVQTAQGFSVIFGSLMLFDLYFFGNPVNVLFSFELIQQISLLQYTNVPLSLDMQSLFQFIQGFHLTDLPPKPFNLDVNSPTSDYNNANESNKTTRMLASIVKSQTAPYKFSSNGKSTNFLNNSIYLMGVHIALWAIIFFCKMSMKNFKMKRLGFMNKVYFYLDLTVMLIVYFITNYEMFLNIILQLNDVDTSTSFNSLSLALAIIFLVYYGFFFIKIIFKINVDKVFFKSKPPSKPYLVNQFTRWCLLFFTVRQRKPLQRNFYIILQLKKMLICILLITLYNYAEAQILSTLFIYILFFVYLVVSKPIVNPYILGLLIINEAFMIVFFIFAFIIQQYQYSVDISIHLNRSLLALLFLLFLVNIIISFFILYKKRKQIYQQLITSFNVIKNFIIKRNRVGDYKQEQNKKKNRKKSQRVDKMGDIIEEEEEIDDEDEDDDDDDEEDDDYNSQDVYLENVEGEGASIQLDEKRLRRIKRKKQQNNINETLPTKPEKIITIDYYNINDNKQKNKRKTGVVYLKEDLNFNQKIELKNHLRRDQRGTKLQNNLSGNINNNNNNNRIQRIGASSIQINQMNKKINSSSNNNGSSQNLNSSILDNSIVNNLDNSMDSSFQQILGGNNSINMNLNNNNNYNNQYNINNIQQNDWDGSQKYLRENLEQIEEIDELIDEALDQDGEINIERIRQLQLKRSDYSPIMNRQDLRNSYIQNQDDEQYIPTQENFNHRPSSRLDGDQLNQSNYYMNRSYFNNYEYNDDNQDNNNNNDGNDNNDDYNLNNDPNNVKQMDVQFQQLFGYDRIEYYDHNAEEEERIQREIQEQRYQEYLRQSQQSALHNINVYQNNSRQSGLKKNNSYVRARDYGDPNLIERYNQVDPEQLKKYLEYKKKYKLTQKFGFLSKPSIGSSPQKLNHSQSRQEDPQRINSQLELFYQQQEMNNYMDE